MRKWWKNGKVSPTLTHGGTSKFRPDLIPIYRVYRGMLNRCYNPNQKSYKHYGAAGVTVDRRWRGEHGFDNFLHDLGLRPPGTSLGRVADLGPYSPTNASWQTYEQQQAEKATKRLLMQLKKVA